MLNPKASVDTLRALSALFLLRVLKPVAVMLAIILAASYALTVMLVLSFTAWWLLLLLLLVPLTVIVLVIGSVLWYLLHRILPRQLSAAERDQLNGFTDKLFAVAEKTKTPYPILLFLVAKDVIRGKESSFLRGLISDSKSLMKELGEIQRLFRN